MKLNELAPTALAQNGVAAMIASSPFLAYPEFYKMTGNADSPRKRSAAAGGKFRAVNSDYAANVVDPQFATVALKIFGDYVETDAANERRGYDIGSVRAVDLKVFFENMGLELTDKLFNSTLSATEFAGIKSLVPAGQIIKIADNGMVIQTGNSDAAKKSQQALLEALSALIGKVKNGAQVIAMNSDVLGRLTSIARDFIRWETNNFGINIPYFQGVPLIAPGFNASGTDIIPATESCGTSEGNTSSIYALRFGEKSDLTIATSNGLDVADLNRVGNMYKYEVDLDAAPVLLNDKAVAKLAGIKLS